MDRTDAVAYVISQAAAAVIEALGMQAENLHRQAQGYAMAYAEMAFQAVIAPYDLEAATVRRLLQEADRR